MCTNCNVVVGLSLMILLLGNMALAHEGGALSGLQSAAELKQIDIEIAEWDKRLAETPDHPIALSKKAELTLRRAEITRKHDDFTDAEKALKKQLLLNERNAAAHVGLARSKFGRHLFSEALAHAKTAEKLDPTSIRTLALIGDLYLAIGDLANADQYFQAYHESVGMTLESLSRQAQLQEARGEIEKSRATFKDALEAGSLLEVSPVYLAWVLSALGESHLQQDELVDADKYFRQALIYDPSQAFSFERRTEIALRRQDYPNALAILDSVFDSTEPRMLRMMAQIEEGLGNSEMASEHLAEARRILEDELERGEIGHRRELIELHLHQKAGAKRAVELAEEELSIRRDSETLIVAAEAYLLLGETGIPRAADLLDELAERGYTNIRMRNVKRQIAQLPGNQLIQE